MPLVLNVESRNVEENPKKLRREGFCPAMLHGQGAENLNLKLSYQELYKLQRSKEHIIELQVKDRKQVKELSIMQEMQRDAITENPLHICFLRIKRGAEVNLTLSVRLEGDPIGVKNGGVLNHALREVEVKCTPENMPEDLSIDVSKMDVGDILHVSDLKLPQGVTADEKILAMELASIQIQKVEAEPEPTEPAEGEEKEEAAKDEKKEESKEKEQPKAEGKDK